MNVLRIINNDLSEMDIGTVEVKKEITTVPAAPFGAYYFRSCSF